ncbi:MAG: protein kinase [Anaerolineales bacterium]|nr:protein kinase [Anaerolineales bacterium]
MTLKENTILENRYRIEGLLAQGGMGAIYKAFDTNLNIPVAIKENILQTPEHIDQFKREALILARLRHAGLPRVIHYFSFSGKQYLVMDFIDGQNLWQIVIDQGGPLPVAQALDYMIQICQAVTYLHMQTPPLIHRDIKPQNIKITSVGRAVLVDFGIAKEISGDLQKTESGARRVTSGFSPPEQYTGQGTTPASDIYALGATLYAILTAKKPPRSTNLTAGEVKFDPPNLVNPSLSPQITQAVLHAMQLKPEDRPETVGLWQQRLETILTGLSSARIIEDSTVFSKRKPDVDDDATLMGEIILDPPSDTAKYWLVDPLGQGYKLGAKPLVIGRSPKADIVVDDQSVSREHAQVRLAGDRCLVLDLDSANGTFLDNRPLPQVWQPVGQGDTLTIGSARFYVTTTEPANVVSHQVVAIPAGDANTTAPPVDLTPSEIIDAERVVDLSQPRVPAHPWRRLLWPILAIVLFFFCGGLTVGGFWWYRAGLAADEPNSGQSAADQGQEEFAPLTGQTSQEVQPDNSVDEVVGTAETETAPETISPIATPTPPFRSALGDVITRTDTISPPRVAATATTAVQLSPPTTEPDPSEPTAAEPTAIPVTAGETVAQIGAKEVIDVDFNPRNPNEVYTVVKGMGIFKSVSGGEGPWLKLNVDGTGLTGLTIDPSNPTRLYAPTWNAVLKSTDGGNTWDLRSDGLASANRSVNELVVHPTKPDTLFGGIGETLVVSTDGGETWVSDGYGRDLGGSQLNQIVIDPFDSETIYVAGTAGSLYKSTDGGRNFIGLPFNTGEGAFSLVAHPTQPNVYLVGVNAAHSAIAKSTDGFEFHSVSDGLIYGGADSIYSALAYAPSSPNIVYAGSGYESNPLAKGVFKSIDDGDTWFSINSNMTVNPDTGYPYYVKRIIVHPTNPDVVLAATGSGLYKSVDGGATWRLL